MTFVQRDSEFTAEVESGLAKSGLESLTFDPDLANPVRLRHGRRWLGSLLDDVNPCLGGVHRGGDFQTQRRKALRNAAFIAWLHDEHIARMIAQKVRQLGRRMALGVQE